MQVFYCDHYQVPLPIEHRFPMAKYARLRRALLSRGILSASAFVPSIPAPLEAVLRVHERSYVMGVIEGTLDAKQQRRIGFPWSPALVRRSLASVEGTRRAAHAALDDGIAGNLAGGTHHAFADGGSGYCVFNDIAIAAAELLALEKIKRAVVVDLDVHQGDGTAKIFAHEPRVFTFSIHGEKNFPFQKQQSDLDIALPDGTGDQEYLDILTRALPDVLSQSNANILFYQAGVDALAEDRLGKLSLSLQGLQERDKIVLSLAKKHNIPVVLTLGGGYAEPLDTTVEAYVGTYEVAKEYYG